LQHHCFAYRLFRGLFVEFFLIFGSFCVVNVYVPRDRVTGAHQGYGFVEFRSEEDADYVQAPFFFDKILSFLVQNDYFLIMFVHWASCMAGY
jgi:hypothetical protein